MHRIYKILICIMLVCGLLAGCAGSGTPETTGATTEATTEMTTEVTTEVTTEATTEVTTEATTEATVETTQETTVREEPQGPVVQPPSGGDSEGLFADAAFIGDSVTLKLRNYNTANGAVSGATFCAKAVIL